MTEQRQEVDNIVRVFHLKPGEELHVRQDGKRTKVVIVQTNPVDQRRKCRP